MCISKSNKIIENICITNFEEQKFKISKFYELKKKEICHLICKGKHSNKFITLKNNEFYLNV